EWGYGMVSVRLAQAGSQLRGLLRRGTLPFGDLEKSARALAGAAPAALLVCRVGRILQGEHSSLVQHPTLPAVLAQDPVFLFEIARMASATGDMQGFENPCPILRMHPHGAAIGNHQGER